MDSDYKRMEIIFSEEEMARIMSIEQADNNLPALQVDLHCMSKKKAKRFLANIISICQRDHLLYIIHGYSHGTVLMEMIHGSLESRKIMSKKLFRTIPVQAF